jgi:hypothetical protein
MAWSRYPPPSRAISFIMNFGSSKELEAHLRNPQVRFYTYNPNSLVPFNLAKISSTNLLVLTTATHYLKMIGTNPTPTLAPLREIQLTSVCTQTRTSTPTPQIGLRS